MRRQLFALLCLAHPLAIAPCPPEASTAGAAGPPAPVAAPPASASGVDPASLGRSVDPRADLPQLSSCKGNAPMVRQNA